MVAAPSSSLLPPATIVKKDKIKTTTTLTQAETMKKVEMEAVAPKALPEDDKQPEKPLEMTPEKPPDKTSEKPPEMAAEKLPEKAAEKLPEKAAEKSPEMAAEKLPEKAVVSPDNKVESSPVVPGQSAPSSSPVTPALDDENNRSIVDRLDVGGKAEELLAMGELTDPEAKYSPGDVPAFLCHDDTGLEYLLTTMQEEWEKRVETAPAAENVKPGDYVICSKEIGGEGARFVRGFVLAISPKGKLSVRRDF